MVDGRRVVLARRRVMARPYPRTRTPLRLRLWSETHARLERFFDRMGRMSHAGGGCADAVIRSTAAARANSRQRGSCRWQRYAGTGADWPREYCSWTGGGGTGIAARRASWRLRAPCPSAIRRPPEYWSMAFRSSAGIGEDGLFPEAAATGARANLCRARASALR